MRWLGVVAGGLIVAAMAATPAAAASSTATTTANLVKAVTLSRVRDLDFGRLTFNPFTGTRAITLSRGGVFTCAIDILCSGTPRTARFNIQGTNKLVALIRVGSTSLSNGTDSIAFVADAPLLVILAGTGGPGIDFDVGGSITVPGTLIGGTYTGTVTITADYF
jgi:Domain of unknown function (DUF4402)